MNFADRIYTLLVFLYGETQANGAWQKLAALVEERRPGLPEGSAAGQGLSEKDAILITYGDVLRQDGEAPLSTLRHFLRKHLPGVFSGVHILPFYPYSSDDGFSVIDYYQVDGSLGSWDDVTALGQEYRLMFDLVLNHVSRESAWFRSFLKNDERYRNYFIVPTPDWNISQVTRPRTSPLLTRFETSDGPRQVWTTFSADQVDLNYANPDVLLDMIALMLFYVEQGASILRLDAVAYLWKSSGTTCNHLPQTHAVVRLLRAVLDWAAAHVLLISETNVPHDENISYFGEMQAETGRTDEAQMVYQFPLAPLTLHTFHTRDATRLSEWAAGLSAPGIFFNFTASHDGIGLQPANGLLSAAEIEALVVRALRHGGKVSYKSTPDGSQVPYELNLTWYDALNDPAKPDPRMDIARFLASQAIMLSLAGVPGIYFHSLFGLRSCHTCGEVTGHARSLNREKFPADSLEQALSQPESLSRQVLDSYRRLLQARFQLPALHPSGGQEVLRLHPAIFALRRASPDGIDQLLCLVNVSPQAQPVQVDLNANGLSNQPEWKDAIGGKIYPTAGEALSLQLEPYQAVWLRPQKGI
ncbi:MAG: DUF3459 domain-containing protein [Chloroflexota bacterium]|nr:MAG: DUF3459 domain-containing protein [Chloroflexota bacterium]